MNNRSALCIVVIGIALCLRFAIAFQGLTYLDRMFLPDDTYYSLSIARNVADKFIPSADGLTLTSGFQPLSVFFMVPVFAAGATNDQAVLVAILFSAICGALACGMFAKVVFDALDSPALAWVAGLIAATSPLIIRNDMNGLETSLALLLSLGAIAACSTFTANPSRRNTLVLGLVIGLMILARVDTAMLAVLIGLVALVRSSLRKTLLVALLAGLVVAPWWIYCTLHFGSPIPESGAAVRQLIESSGKQGISLEAAALQVASTVMDSVHIQPFMPESALLLMLALAFGVALFAAWRYNLDGLALLIAGGVPVCLFYVFYLPAFWFFHRYLHFAAFAFITCFLVLIWWLVASALQLRGMIVAGVGALVIALNLIDVSVFFSKPSATLYSDFEGAKGYREIAVDILSVLPEGAMLGALQSGALAYYADRHIRVVNLDGVVNADAYRAIKQRKLSEYMVASKIDYVAGWDVDRYQIGLRSSRSDIPLHFQKIDSFKSQGLDRFFLYRVIFS